MLQTIPLRHMFAILKNQGGRKIVKKMTKSVFKFYERGMKDVPDKYTFFEEWDKHYTK